MAKDYKGILEEELKKAEDEVAERQRLEEELRLKQLEDEKNA